MSAGWAEALDHQLDLYLFATSDRGQTSLRQWGMGTEHRSIDRDVPYLALMGEPFWVDPDMQTLWEHATESFVAEALHPQDLLSDCGFVYLPRPYTMLDRHGRRTAFRAFAWMERDIEIKAPESIAKLRGLEVVFFHQIGDVDDYDNGTHVWMPDAPRTAEALNREQRDGIGSREWADTATWIPYTNPRMLIRKGDLTVDHVYSWVYGRDSEGRVAVVKQGDMLVSDDARILAESAMAAEDKARNVMATSPMNIQRPVQCLFRLMQQTIATRTQIEAPRAFRHRWKRANLLAKKVTVIRLRRPAWVAPDNHVPKPVEWSHRWLVAGHWRNQPYPTLGITRQIWISPYIKGPDDAPLEIRRLRAFEFKR